MRANTTDTMLLAMRANTTDTMLSAKRANTSDNRSSITKMVVISIRVELQTCSGFQYIRNERNL